MKHDALCDTVGALILGNTQMENTEKTKVCLSLAAFSEDDGSHQVDYGDLIEQIKLDRKEEKTEQITAKESSENGDKNKDTEVNNDQEEKQGSSNKRDILVGGASTDDNSMEGYSKNVEVENSEGKNKADVGY